MSEPPANPSITGALTTVSERLIKVLPPAFLVLVILNIIFLGLAMWVFSHNTEVRNEMLKQIIERCLDHSRH